MKERFKGLLPELRDAKASVDASESTEDVANLSNVLDKLMKFSHDCTHSSRGCIRSDAPQQSIKWFLDSITRILKTLEALELTNCDAYMDLSEEKSMMSKHVIEPPPLVAVSAPSDDLPVAVPSVEMTVEV